MSPSSAARVRRRRAAVLAAGSLSCLLLLPLSGALAQSGGFLGALFGAITGYRAPEAQRAPPMAGPFDPSPDAPQMRAAEGRGAPSGRGEAFCVRLCDGRHFPVARNAGASPAELCHALCPASKTRIYRGAGIAASVAEDGSRYRDLQAAFVYRERLVADCTCNGRDGLGLASIDLASDPTLRAGDVVMTAQGPQVFTGTAKAHGRSFTPVAGRWGHRAESRGRLTSTKTAPAE